MSLLKTPRERKECTSCRVTLTAREGGICVRCENSAKSKKIIYDCLLCDGRTSRDIHICSRHGVAEIHQFLKNESKPAQTAEQALSRVIEHVKNVTESEVNPLDMAENQASRRISETIKRLKDFYEGSTNASTVAEWECGSETSEPPE